MLDDRLDLGEVEILENSQTAQSVDFKIPILAVIFFLGKIVKLVFTFLYYIDNYIKSPQKDACNHHLVLQTSGRNRNLEATVQNSGFPSLSSHPRLNINQLIISIFLF